MLARGGTDESGEGESWVPGSRWCASVAVDTDTDTGKRSLIPALRQTVITYLIRTDATPNNVTNPVTPNTLN